MTIQFEPWPKTARLFREVVVTEKIDGTNSAVVIEELPYDYYTEHDWPSSLLTVIPGPEKMDIARPAFEYAVHAQSRKRFITPMDDNHGFARWVKDNATSLVRDLGEGRHYGEWWGAGIQRGYGLRKGDKRFSLFNLDRWFGAPFTTPGLSTVPILYGGDFDTRIIHSVARYLAASGSIAALGYDRPEGICVYHTASRTIHKYTLWDDDAKGNA